MSIRWKRNQRLKCGCKGYWFPHRITSGSCEKRVDKLAALLCKIQREGGSAAVEEYKADMNADIYAGTPATECPF